MNYYWWIDDDDDDDDDDSWCNDDGKIIYSMMMQAASYIFRLYICCFGGFLQAVAETPVATHTVAGSSVQDGLDGQLQEALNWKTWSAAVPLSSTSH